MISSSFCDVTYTIRPLSQSNCYNKLTQWCISLVFSISRFSQPTSNSVFLSIEDIFNVFEEIWIQEHLILLDNGKLVWKYKPEKRLWAFIRVFLLTLYKHNKVFSTLCMCKISHECYLIPPFTDLQKDPFLSAKRTVCWHTVIM